MLATTGDTERTRLFVLIDAEIRTAAETAVQDSVFSYLSEKVPGLSPNIFEVHSYDHESGLLSTERINTSTLNIWSGRLTEPDANIPGRSWLLELTISEAEGRKRFGSRLSCFSRHLDFYFNPAVPRVYRDLVSQGILFGDGIKLSRTPIDITNEDEVEWLVALITSQRRKRNIIVLSSDSSGHCAVNPDVFSDRLCGVAHVVRIFPTAAFRLSASIGRYLSVFDSGIRIYRPTSNIEADDPLQHTLYTKRDIAKVDINRVYYSITADAFANTVEGSIRSSPLPTFVQIRSANAALRLSELQESLDSTEHGSLRAQLDASQNARLAAEAQAREALDLAIQEETARREADDERNQIRARAMVLAARVRALEAQLGRSADKITAKPHDYDEIGPWVEKEFAGRMKLHSRALRGLKDAVFGDLQLVCDLLALLASDYVDSKRGDREAWQRFENNLKSHGVDFSKSISEARAGEQGDEYFVRYKGDRTFLEWHLKKGTSRDAARDLRIYFFWDDEDEEVVIGYLPGHLDNRIT
jgi:hypothetical protein